MRGRPWSPGSAGPWAQRDRSCWSPGRPAMSWRPHPTRWTRAGSSSWSPRAAGWPRAAPQWPGPPLADVAYQDFAQTEIARLEEARLAAQEDWIEAQLADGHHAQLVAQLEQLVAANPLRERLRAQLMLALYRQGRALLEEELGLDPAPALRQLEQAILTQDPTLAAATRPGSARRHNLPARVTSFVGRARDRQEL